MGFMFRSPELAEHPKDNRNVVWTCMWTYDRPRLEAEKLRWAQYKLLSM